MRKKKDYLCDQLCGNMFDFISQIYFFAELKIISFLNINLKF